LAEKLETRNCFLELATGDLLTEHTQEWYHFVNSLQIVGHNCLTASRMLENSFKQGQELQSGL